MKKAILVAPLLFVSLGVGLVHAESAENVTKRRSDAPERVQIQEIRQERKENVEEMKSKLQTMRSNIAENHATRLSKRFEYYYSRLTNIMARFDKRLDVLKADGKDVTALKTKLEQVRAKLGEAKTAGDAAVAAFKAIDPAKFSEQKTQAQAARDQAISARKLYLEAHKLLKEALSSLKAMSKPALPASSAAVSNTN